MSKKSKCHVFKGVISIHLEALQQVAYKEVVQEEALELEEAQEEVREEAHEEVREEAQEEG